MDTAFKALEQVLQDEKNRKKMETAMAEIAQSDAITRPDDAFVEAARRVFGIEINLADLAKARASEEELDPEELKSVSGGETAVQCEKDYACYIAYRHGDKEDKTEACWWNYVCFGIYYCNKASN